MKRIIALVVLTTGCFAITTFAAQAAQGDSKQPNVSQEKGKEGSAAAVAVLNQAADLVKYARENESPLAMLTAVQMIRRVKAQDGSEHVGAKKSEAQQGGDKGKEAAKGSNPAPTLDTQKLLAEAKTWAKGDAHVMALLNAESAKAPSSLGGTLGAAGSALYHFDRAHGRTIDTYTVTFRGEEVARIAAIGDGDTDLDLYVYDENGNLITSDTDGSDNCVVQWTPRWTGQFAVKIVNRGYLDNVYLLMTN